MQNLLPLRRIRRAVTGALRKTTLGTCAVFMVDNQLAKLKLVRGDIGTDSGTAHDKLSLSESLAYIDWVYDDYKAQGGVERFFGRIAEIGPGDNCGVALRFMADGAESLDLADRYYSARDLEKHASIYRALIEREHLDKFVGLDKEGQFTGIERHYGISASAENFFISNRNYDFIVSRAVMEHVSDPLISLQRMTDALNPGGIMMHAVDLRDHGMFTDFGFHPLKFLEIPDWAYREMSHATGRPNRVPLSAYRKTLPDATFKVTHLVGGNRLRAPITYNGILEQEKRDALSRVRGIKTRLQNRFQQERDEDLSVSAFFMIYRKPVEPSQPIQILE